MPVQGQSLRLSLRPLIGMGTNTPSTPSAHLAVQEAVEDGDEETLEGDKR